jgi:hypothetical protein
MQISTSVGVVHAMVVFLFDFFALALFGQFAPRTVLPSQAAAHGCIISHSRRLTQGGLLRCSITSASEHAEMLSQIDTANRASQADMLSSSLMIRRAG